MPADLGWKLNFSRGSLNAIRRWGVGNADFVPPLGELFEALSHNPYQFPEKRGALKGARAAALTYRGQTWRLIYDVDEYAREVYVLAIGEHDAAYDEAERRRYR